MTTDETKKVMAYLAAAYPRYYANLTKGQVEKMSIPWHEALKEYSSGLVIAGVKSYIATDSSGFPPAPGQIIAHIYESAPDTRVSAQEAWALVRKAVNVPWERMQESFDSLPKAIRKAVGSAASLKELAQMDIATFESVAGSNFIRTYNAVVKREAEHERMPSISSEVRERIAEELEARRAKRQLETKTAEVIPFPLPKAPEEIPERENVSEDSIDKGMQRLRAKLGV